VKLSGQLRCGAAVFLVFPAVVFAATTNVVSPEVAAATNAWREVTTDEMDVKCLTPKGKQLLDESGDKWKHAQTDHYVVHYFAAEGDLQARKTVALTEFCYNYIPRDLGLTHDRIEGRSHIFTFRNEDRWKKFLKTVPNVDKWSFSFAEGPALFLQQAKNVQWGAHNMTHETTHMVLYRFLRDRPPLWLNEGTAEYYGDFGLAEFRGLKRYSGTVFKGLREPIPLTRLFSFDEKYPTDIKEVHQFYATAEYFVGFLMTKKPHDQFSGFLKDMTEENAKPLPLLQKHYDFPDMETVQKEFKHFCR
jgi:hypothetical protein